MNAGKRVLVGENLFMTAFTNIGAGKKKVSFAAPYTGKIIPLDLQQLGGTIIAQKDAFLCAARARFGCNPCPISRLASRIIQYSPRFGSRREDGSILGGLGNLLDGDGF
jgi:hypothetical protein